MTAKHFEFLVKAGVKKADDDKDIIYNAVNRLINALYIPVKETGRVNMVDPERTRLFEIGNEPINWGDLSCAEVEKFDTGEYLVSIAEAMPDSCPGLCRYIHEYMKAYGWNCRIETEW